MVNSISFNEAPLTPIDGRSGAAPFTLPSNPGVLDPGPVQGNKAYQFDGTANSVLQAVSADTFKPGANESLTVAFWIVPNTVDAIQWMATRYKNAAGERSWQVTLWSDSTIQVYLSESGSTWDINLVSTTLAETGVPMHIAMVFDSGNEAALWINGVKEDSTATAITTLDAAGGAKLTLGSRHDKDSLFYDGAMDQLDLAKRAWVEADVTAHRNGGNGLEVENFEYADPSYTTGAWVENPGAPWDSFTGDASGFSGTGTLTSNNDALINQNFKGIIEGLYLHISFTASLGVGQSMRFQFANGTGFSVKQGGAAVGVLSDPVGCTIASNRVIVNASGEVSFKAKSISGVFDHIVFQMEGFDTTFQYAISDFTMIKT